MPNVDLRHVDDSLPGISRRRLKRGWAYHDNEGRRITDRDEIDRLNAIGMPPAYERCWFCADPSGHIQATGYDARGRKQYRYHVEFRAAQDAGKFDRCAAFGMALPKLRARVDHAISGRAPTRDAVIAAVVRLLDIGFIRVGNESYARENRSFGATTLRNRHATLTRERIRLVFRGKSGKLHKLTIADRRLARIVRRCQDLPGQRLFQYLNGDGTPHPVGSSEVNAWLREATGEDFSAKHFRTWSASVIAFETLVAAKGPISVKALVEPVCAALGNTPAIARKSYIHPALIDAAREGLPKGLNMPRRTKYLSATERGLIAFLTNGGTD